jgi:hypothetical protein
MQRRVPDVSRLKQLTGLSPTASIDQIINEVIEAGIPEGAL